MATFSERYGYKSVRAALGQYESMDDRLRIAIWNFFQNSGYIYDLAPDITDRLMRVPAGPFEIDRYNASIKIREWFFRIAWNEVYDFIEFCLQHKIKNHPFTHHEIEEEIRELNGTLENEGSAYRIVNGRVTPISDTQESAEAEEAATSNDYIQKAVELLANRETPDPENVIKESTSAVEYAVREATGDEIAKGLEKLAIHPQLAQAWKNMYHWASQEPGVRHANTDEPKVGIAEARYVLIAASAFVNYLKLKGQQ